MLDNPESTNAQRMLLERYLRGAPPQTAAPARTICRRSPGILAPLSLEQEQLWPLAHALRNVPVYTECVTLHLPGQLDRATLERSFSEIIRRHEAWRTSFPVVNGQTVQLIHAAGPINLPLVDLHGLPEAERETTATQVAAAEARKPFDLANGPLVRATLVRLGDFEHRLYLTLHYLIFDGVSLYRVFLPELHALYEAYSSGRPSPLPEAPIQYADYAHWQRGHPGGDAFASQLSYWKRQLADAPASLALPADHARPTVNSYHGAMYPFALSWELTCALKALSQQESCTLFMTMLAAFITLLYGYSGQDDIVVGTRTSGRTRPEVQGLMGYFLHTVAVRTSLTDNPSFREVVAQVRKATLDALCHEDVPFDHVLDALRVKQNPTSMPPLFQVMLTLEPPLPVLQSGWTLTQMDIDTETSKYDLYLELDDRPQGLIGRFEYSTDLFDPQTIARMVEQWVSLLERIVTDPTQRVSELQLDAAVDWNRRTMHATAPSESSLQNEGIG
jgi:condensation domain-containing protein